MFKGALRRFLVEAAERAIALGRLPPVTLPPVEVEIPRGRRHADYASSLPLALAGTVQRSPREVAQVLVESLDIPTSQVARVEVAGPGFINFFLAPAWLHDLVRQIHAAGDRYGAQDLGGGARVNVEFVSANPTGPLHIGNGRNAVIGDVLANLLQALGFRVSREYYINDAGTQVRNLARSVEHHYLARFGRSVEFPKDGYPGAYVEEIATTVAGRDGDRWVARPPEERLEAFREDALEAVLREVRHSLDEFGVQFDTWFSERTLHESGALARTVEALRERGYVYDQDGAVWFRSTAFGDDRDRVMIRSTGEPTYFATDIPYHLNKLDRGFDRLIDIWGYGHIGDVARVRGGLAALGVDVARVEILLYQNVRLLKEGELLRLGKRRGNFVTLQDLIDAIGRDAARYFYCMFTPSVPMDFDWELARRKTQDNPVFYVQYAHARIISILREAAAHPAARSLVEAGGLSEAGIEAAYAHDADLAPLIHEAEMALMHSLADLPDVIETAGLRREPQRLCAYARDLAEQFHAFYTQCRVLTDDPALTHARVILTAATRLALRRTLGLIGVSAPDRM